MENSREREDGTRVLLWMILLAIIASSSTACGPMGSQDGSGSQGEGPAASDGDGSQGPYPEGSKVVGQVRVPVKLAQDDQGRVVDTIRFGASGLLRTSTSSVDVTVDSLAQCEIDGQNFNMPVVLEAERLSLGALVLSNYLDNDLRICGVTGRQKCSKLQIRLYTVEGEGQGLYNNVDAYGLPIEAGLSTAQPTVVGEGAQGAAVLQEVSIPANKNVLRLSDFSVAPVYQVAVDFSNAGRGSYAANLVIESLLLP